MDRVERFLTALAAPNRGEIADVNIAVVVAHPDDESIGIGGQLPRFRNVVIIVVTDGAPRDEADAHAHGFASWRDYSAARRAELGAALAEAGVGADRIVRLDRADKVAALDLAGITRALVEILRGRHIDIVVTQPYEGGHPDHDATAFAVKAAAALLMRAGAPGPAVVEMTSYHPGPGALVRQRFASDPSCPETLVPLARDSLAVKRRMFAAHRTQAPQLAYFTAEDERFRRAPDYDFTAPANRGTVHYDQITPGLTTSLWCRLARGALTELGLG